MGKRDVTFGLPTLIYGLYPRMVGHIAVTRGVLPIDALGHVILEPMICLRDVRGFWEGGRDCRSRVILLHRWQGGHFANFHH
jgi:hypothetical protein